MDVSIKEMSDRILSLEKEMNAYQDQIDNKYAELLKHTKNIFEEYNAKIISGRIFTDVILESITAAYKTGFIDYLPKFYADNEVAKRIREIEQVISSNN